MKKYSNDICFNCGASEGLHHYKTKQCPKNGIEETRYDKLTGKFYPQQWQMTTFEDSGIRFIELAAIDLFEAAIFTVESFKKASNVPLSLNEGYEKLKQAIKKATKYF